jgi:hypothetical protein
LAGLPGNREALMLRSIAAKPWTLAALGAFIFCSLLAPSPSLGTQHQYLRRDEAGNLFDPLLKDVTAYTVERRLTHPDCPGANYWLRYSVPVGTGNPLLDRALASDMEQDALRVEEAFLESLDSESCPDPNYDNGDYDERRFEIHAPGGGFLSILFSTSGYNHGDTHGHVAYDVINVDPEKAALLTIENIFQNPPGAAAGVQAFWPEMAARWCNANWRQTIPNFYDLGADRNWCANPGGSPMPARLRRDPSIDSFGVTFFTRNGMSIMLGPYSAWDYDDGTVMIEFSKAELVEIGFEPSLWSWDEWEVVR